MSPYFLKLCCKGQIVTCLLHYLFKLLLTYAQHTHVPLNNNISFWNWKNILFSNHSYYSARHLSLTMYSACYVFAQSLNLSISEVSAFFVTHNLQTWLNYTSSPDPDQWWRLWTAGIPTLTLVALRYSQPPSLKIPCSPFYIHELIFNPINSVSFNFA